MIKKQFKKIFKSYSNMSYHLAHKKSALKILNNIESVKGKTNPKLLKLSDEYAMDIFGWKGYAPWLYVYSAMNDKFKEGWIPDNYYGKVVVPNLKGNYGLIADFKSLTSLLFDSKHFPDIAYFTNGLWLSPKYQFMTDKQINALACGQGEKLVYKVDNSLQGKGVYFVNKDNINIETLKTLGNGVLQNYIKQHNFFNDIIQNSVATLRITSVINDKGEVSVRACYLRVGRGSDTHVKSASHIRIPISISNGQLEKFGYTTSWLQIEKHPDTGFLFENKQIPHFNEFLETAITLHKKVPFTRIIGWDMILDVNNNVKVMEWNGSHNDIKFSEATQGPCFHDLGFQELWKKAIN